MNQKVLHEIETWVANPVIRNSSADLDNYIQSIQTAMKAEDADKRKLGQLLGKLKGLQRTLSDMKSKD